MPLSKRSKIKQVWTHPVGHELVQAFLRQSGRTEKWVENPLVANLPLQSLDRFAGAGFADMVLEMCAHVPEHVARISQQEKAWWKEAVVYQVFLPSFMDADHDGVGDIGGVVQRLPYLQRLGVDTLYLWPVLDAPRCLMGAVRDYRQVAAEYGDMELLEELLQQAHQRGMRVVMGLDIAATSDEHPWFLAALQGEGGDRYIFRPGSPDVPPNNWMREGSGSVWSWYPQLEAWGLHLNGAGRMDLNWDNAAVRAEMADALRFWADKGMDGFCFGPVNALSKSGFENGNPAFTEVMGGCGYEKYAYGPRLHRYLRELREAVGVEGLFYGGRADGISTEMAKLFTGGERQELDMLFDSSHLAPKINPKPRGRAGDDQHMSLEDLKQYYLGWMEKYGGECWMSLFLVTSETARMVSRLGANGLYRAILAKLLATLLLTLRGTPAIYQGQELGLANTRFSNIDELTDPGVRQKYAEELERYGEQAAFQRVLCNASDHTHLPMPWSAGPKAGFTGAEPWMRLPDGTEYLNAAAQMEDGGSVWSHYRRLIAMRKKHPGLVYGGFNPVFAKNKKVFCYFRILEGEKWYVEMNITEKEVARPGRILRSQKLVLSNYDSPSRSLRPYEANLYRCE